MQVRVARAVLHVSQYEADGLPACRTDQVTKLEDVIGCHLAQRQAGAVYVSGLPGTGEKPLLAL